jgi:hypothetical protein
MTHTYIPRTDVLTSLCALAGCGKHRNDEVHKRMSERDAWFNSEHPPWLTAVNHGSGVWSAWYQGDTHPLVWHWCTRTVIIRKRAEDHPDRLPEWYEPQWVLVGTAGHDIVQREPLTLHPSILWPDCCELHGWIQEGVWHL